MVAPGGVLVANELLTQVKRVNDLLEAGEPRNVSLDEHTSYTGYKPQFVCDAMNEVFGIGAWGFEEVSNEISATQDGKGLAIAQVRVWLAGSDFKPTGWGQNRITRGDTGDAKKGAQTDALKKALSYFSVGTRAYQGLLVAGEKGKQNGNAQPQRPPQSRPLVQATAKSEPDLDLATVATRVGKAFDFKPSDFEARWVACKQHVIGSAKPDSELSQGDLKKLLNCAIAHENKTAKVAQAS
jgi:hypothetical protein